MNLFNRFNLEKSKAEGDINRITKELGKRSKPAVERLEIIKALDEILQKSSPNSPEYKINGLLMTQVCMPLSRRKKILIFAFPL